MPEITNKPLERDYEGPIEKTSVELANMILAKMDNLKSFLIIESIDKLNPLKKAAFIEKSTDFSIDVLKEIAKSDIPYPYATRGIDKIIMVLESLKQYIEGTITQNRDEILSRVYGVKNEKGKYTHQEATVGQVALKLEEVRNATGGDKYDYFNKPEETKLSPDSEKSEVASENSKE